jgi:uncharacterized repeat protein (TIGR01451 family)
MLPFHHHRSVSSRVRALLWTIPICAAWTLALLWALSAPTRAAEPDTGLAVDLGASSEFASLGPDSDAIAPRVTESINDGTADLILTGSQSDERFGCYAMDTVGDVNGDGYVDIIVGSYRYDMDGGAETFDGIVYIFPGSGSGVAATPIVALTIGQAEARFGNKVAGLGDVNGDGYPDVAIGASYYDAPTNNEGAVFVYYGSTSGISTTPSITLTGVATTTYLGVGVAGAGDVNADGYDDLIAAGNGYDNGEENEGAAFVYHGSAAGLSATPAVTIENNITDTLLRAVAGAGDVNGDGYADVVIGSSDYNSGDGIAYVHYGSAAGISATPAVTLTSAQAADLFAVGLDGAGDVNGDGYADLVVGAQHYANGQTNEGAFFVYHGSAAGISATPSITVERDLANARLGNAVAGVGDTDGDGYADVLVGARIYDLPYNDAGAAFLYHGAAGGIDTANPVWLTGVAPYLQYGFNVAGAGDVNADGYADIMVAQDYYNDPVSRAGAVYIYHGGAQEMQSAPAWTATGESNGTFFGKVAPAGDVNGDGFSDAIVGSYGYMTNTGRAYLYLGAADGLSATPALTLTGGNEGDRFGQFVATAGDVNGDGYADVFVGAPGYITNTGRAYLYLGGPSGLSDVPSVTLAGENEMDYFGRGGTAGDVNGDGYGDVVIGAANYPGGTAEGKVYVYHGSATGLSVTPASTATGENAGDNFGVSLGIAGDVNGDGYADVVIGASVYGGANNGRIYVYYGSAVGLSATDLVSVTGTSSDERLGVAVSTAGDVNGDGYADIVAGGDYYASQSGIAYVFLGGSTGLDTSPIFAESDASPHFGRAVGAAGDVNGDGYDDIVVGTSTYSGFTNRRGRILVYYGSATGPDGDPDFVATGETTNSRFGDSVGTAGDVNGDGLPDLLVGATHYPNDNDLGKAYLYASGMGRSVLASQLRGDGSGTPVQTWGLSHDASSFTAQINATDPRGQGNVKLQVEACPAGTPFGNVSCVDNVAPDWTMTGLAGAVLEETLTGLSGDTVYAWRVRVVYDSHANPHGPWRRYLASSLQADLRVGAPPDVAVEKTVVPLLVGPGDMVTYTLVFSNAGSLVAPDVVITDHVPVTLTDVHYAATRPVTPIGAFSYTWEVGALGAGEGGTITVTGVVSGDVTGVFDLLNEATIAAPGVDDGNPGNSTSTASNTVDGDPPEILAVSPGAGAEGVALGASVVITFGEAIDADTFAYAVIPDPGGWMAMWSGDNSVVTLTHDAFDAGEVYTVTVTTANDVVGNVLVGLPYEWSFETVHYQIYLPVVLRE